MVWKRAGRWEKTVRRVWDQMRKSRIKAEAQEERAAASGPTDRKPVEDLRALIVACVKSNFVGLENPRLYSQTYYGTKNLVQNFTDEGKATSDPPWFSLRGFIFNLTYHNGLQNGFKDISYGIYAANMGRDKSGR